MKKRIYCTIIVTILIFLGIGVLEGTCKQQVVYAEEATEENTVEIVVSYCDFLVKGSDGSYVKVKDMQKQEGDIEISNGRVETECGGPIELRFELHHFKSDVDYTIIPDNSETEWEDYNTKIVFYNNVKQEGYGYTVQTKKYVEVNFLQNQTITTKTKEDEKIEQKIHILSTNLFCGLESMFYVTATDSEINLQVKEGKLYVEPKSDRPIRISFQCRSLYMTFANLKSSNRTFIVGQDGEEVYVTDGEGKELARKSCNIGYMVHFTTGTEEYIDSLTEVLEGSKIEEPKLKARAGYRFDGWYKYDSGKFLKENKWDFSKDIVDESMILVAKWTKIEKPEKVKLQSVKKAGSGKAKVTWKKLKDVTGYQVTYSTSKKFTKAKTKNVTVSGGKSNVTLKKLRKGKTYYVKVRAYKKNGNSKDYGKYSTVKKIKIRR